MSSIATPNLTEEQLYELTALIDEADSVELKLTVPDEDRRSTIVALGIDPLDAQLRQIFFFDTTGLDLDAAGVVARARRTQGRADDSVIKLRPVTPATLPPQVRAAKSFGVEVDAMPGGFVCSASFKGETKKVREAVSGDRPLHKLFGSKQREFYDDHAPEGLGLDDLSVLGPVHVLKLKHYIAELDRKLAVEFWFYPDGSRILELSTKCKPVQAFEVAAETRAHLEKLGVNLLGEQETKTRTALEYFAKHAGALPV